MFLNLQKFNLYYHLKVKKNFDRILLQHTPRKQIKFDIQTFRCIIVFLEFIYYN